MARIEDFAQPEIPSTERVSVAEIPTSMGADASPERVIFRQLPPTQPETRSAMTDEEREQAICRAAALMEYLHALAQFHWALCNGEGDYFTHRAAYDLALSDCHAARGIMERLIKGRSAQKVRELEKARGLDLPACANEERHG